MAKRNGADPRQRQLGSIEAEVVKEVVRPGETAVALPGSVAEFDGWNGDDVIRWLISLKVNFRQLRAVVGLGLWVLRDRTDGEPAYTKAVRGLAEHLDVSVGTLWRWRTAAQAELGLPDPKGTEGRSRAARAGVAARAVGRAARPTDEAIEPAALQIVARDDTRRAEVQPPAAQAEGPGATGTTGSPRAPGSSSARGAEPPAPPSLAAALDVVVGYKPTEARSIDGAAFARFESWVAQAKAVRRQLATSAAAKGGRCSHPKDREKKLPYGVFCGECETKIQ